MSHSSLKGESSTASSTREVPMVYLDQCLKSAPYARDLAPFLVDEDPFLLYAFALNELLTMDFSGLLQLKATVFLMWREPRLRWHRSVVPPPQPTTTPSTPATTTPTAPEGPRLGEISSIDIGASRPHLINRPADVPKRPSNSTAAGAFREHNVVNKGEGPRVGPISEAKRRVTWVWPENVDLEPSRLWMPRLMLLNCMKRQCTLVPGNDSLVQLSKHGFVRVTFTAYLEASCNMNLHKFPFDSQSCELEFALMNYPSRNPLRMVTNPASVAFYVSDGEEWQVEKLETYNTIRKLVTYASRGGNQNRWFRNRLRNQTEFHGFTVRIHVVRHSIFYVYNIVIPLLVVIMIALACTLFPSESEEKPNLLMSVILAYVFFADVLAENSPKVDEEPLLAEYIMYSMIHSALLLIGSHVVIKLSHSTHSVPPRLLCFVLLWPNKLACGWWGRARLRSAAFLTRISRNFEEQLVRGRGGSRTQSQRVNKNMKMSAIGRDHNYHRGPYDPPPPPPTTIPSQPPPPPPPRLRSILRQPLNEAPSNDLSSQVPIHPPPAVPDSSTPSVVHMCITTALDRVPSSTQQVSLSSTSVPQPVMSGTEASGTVASTSIAQPHVREELCQESPVRTLDETYNPHTLRRADMQQSIRIQKLLARNKALEGALHKHVELVDPLPSRLITDDGVGDRLVNSVPEGGSHEDRVVFRHSHVNMHHHHYREQDPARELEHDLGLDMVNEGLELEHMHDTWRDIARCLNLYMGIIFWLCNIGTFVAFMLPLIDEWKWSGPTHMFFDDSSLTVEGFQELVAKELRNIDLKLKIKP